MRCRAPWRLTGSIGVQCLFLLFLLTLAVAVGAQTSVTLRVGEPYKAAAGVNERQAVINGITVSNQNVVQVRDAGNYVLITGDAPGTSTVSFRKSLDGGKTYKTYTFSITVSDRNYKSIFDKGTDTSSNGSGGNSDGSGGAKPIKTTDFAPVGAPKKVPLAAGAYKEVYKNAAGQVVQEKEYDAKGTLLNTRDFEAAYPNGKPASVTNTNAKGELELVFYDPAGKVTRTEKYTDLDKFSQATTKTVTEDGKTTVFKRDKDGKWVPADNVKTDKPVQPPVANGQLDKCVVGDWLSKSLRGRNADTGGGGMLLKITADGTAIFNYNASQEYSTPGITTRWYGMATGKVSTKNGELIPGQLIKSDVENEITMYGQTKRKPSNDFGEILLKASSYTCTPTELKLTEILFGEKLKDIIFEKAN